MNAPRHAKFRPLEQESRASLNKAVHPEVDAALKSVKKCRRNLAAMLEIIQDERDILERLYYKGKNQHGAALFWKRVTETRRFTQRLDAVAFLDLLDTFMLSFFTLNAIPDKMKGSWVFYPSTQYCTSVQRRLEAGLALIEQTKVRLIACHKHLSLAMQAGAFAQIIILFMAIVSRLRTALDDCGEYLGNAISVVERLRAVLKSGPSPPSPPQVRSPSPPSEPEPVPVAVPIVPPSQPASKPKKPKRKKADEIDSIFGF